MKSEGIYIIAEAGVNHNGDIETALSLVDEAANAGADAVKFQTFRAEEMVSESAPQARYQEVNSGKKEAQIEMLKRLELSEEDHQTIIDRCLSREIQFLSTPFDLLSLDLLVNRFNMPAIKIGSGDITNGPLLFAAAKTGKPIILSTGMSDLKEVERAVRVLESGYSYASEEQKVFLLHCTSSYPTSDEDVNLRAMDTLAKTFHLPVGYSDHTEGITIPIAAAARGAKVLEKHFTLDRNMPGPDHRASLEPVELADMIQSVRKVEKALGDGEKIPQHSELETRKVARKSLVAARDISEGTVLQEGDIASMRTGEEGLSPMAYWNLLGTKAKKGYRSGDVFEL